MKNWLCFLISLPVEKQTFVNDMWMPFSPKKYKTLLTKDFSDNEDHLDENNIPDDQQVAPNPNLQPMNMDQNWLMLFLNGLLPWNNLPNNNNNNVDHDDLD